MSLRSILVTEPAGDPPASIGEIDFDAALAEAILPETEPASGEIPVGLLAPAFDFFDPPDEAVEVSQEYGTLLRSELDPSAEWPWPKAEPIPSFYDWRTRNWFVA